MLLIKAGDPVHLVLKIVARGIGELSRIQSGPGDKKRGRPSLDSLVNELVE